MVLSKPVGNQLVLLDATYRVCRYGMPLYFLYVKTNVCYLVVAAFIKNSKQTKDIREVLEMIASWNPGFVSKRTLADFAAYQRNAVKSVWPSCCVNLPMFLVLMQLMDDMFANSVG